MMRALSGVIVNLQPPTYSCDHPYCSPIIYLSNQQPKPVPLVCIIYFMQAIISLKLLCQPNVYMTVYMTGNGSYKKSQLRACHRTGAECEDLGSEKGCAPPALRFKQIGLPVSPRKEEFTSRRYSDSILTLGEQSGRSERASESCAPVVG